MSGLHRREFLHRTLKASVGLGTAVTTIGKHDAMAESVHAADLILRGGKIYSLDPSDSIHQAIAVSGRHIIGLGRNTDIDGLRAQNTRIIDLAGRTVIPGLIESHVHALGVARASLAGPYAELHTIPKIQDWIQNRAAQVPPGTWILVPRNDITRLVERRHPTPAELDAACTTHPVAFEAARRWVLNTSGFHAAGMTGESALPPGAKILRDQRGNPRMLFGADAKLRGLIAGPNPSEEHQLEALRQVLGRYNAVGITSIYERALDGAGHAIFRRLLDRDPLIRVTFSLRGTMRSEADVRRFVEQSGFKPLAGDEWLRAGSLKIVVDGGIHWGNTYLREAYGPRRAAFYVHDDPQYRGDIHYSAEEMRNVFLTAHRMGWPMCVHVTGDGAMDRVLDALEAVDRDLPVSGRRFTLCHAYFPDARIVARCQRFGVCVDTQPAQYYRDSEAIAEVYGASWADRLIGLGQWVRGGIRVAINSDHMIGLDPDHAMNAFNPMLQMWIAVARRNDQGNTHGPHQRLSRLQALRAMTTEAAWISFNEDRVGSLEPGKCADLVVLDRDPLTCREDQIPEVHAVTTIVGGRIVHQNQSG
ncbi:MAG TPA: amidohydrolase [Verrucomicrobiae bacterium]|nr:amidohydrolase [Verrucomicrobiae bacterium]